MEISTVAEVLIVAEAFFFRLFDRLEHASPICVFEGTAKNR